MGNFISNILQIEKIFFMGLRSKDKRDIYYRLSKTMGYRARSAYKLKHINDKYKILENKKYIVDLCAAPGSWSQVARKEIGNNQDTIIVAVDLQEMHPIDGVICLKEDITSESCVNKIFDIFSKNKADLVLCDGAPDITGLHDLDEYYQNQLLVSALSITLKIAEVGSTFLGKCFRGEDTCYLLEHFKLFFDDVILVKPKSSRAKSIEIFILCRGLKKVDINPYHINFNIEIQPMEVYSCGDDDYDPDVTYELEEEPTEHKFPPIEPPYADVIKLRREQSHNKK
ncbi:hypothetical protein SLOPH_232 [Spraguea lophii 42_110]|uniref:Ribosomal RNA methyltransferase FtsJ domain-containing protein n=1 Tax=Spraguea lophii (strain 42_110) TaxID=1358809 RepID=S7WE86_SPRLO|nr:hypothetical protein SLOPH_232 [Spraguea lophii 42_110]